MTARSHDGPENSRSRSRRRLWGGVVAGIFGAVTAGQLIAPAPALARDYLGELMLLCFDAGSAGCEHHPAGLPGPANSRCPAAIRLNGDDTSADDLIKSVSYLDRHCKDTHTTVVGHSIGAVRAEKAAKHFGRGYQGNAKFVINGGPVGPAELRSMPRGTVINCNYADIVCDRQHGDVLQYSIHMPEHYPSSYDHHRAGFNLIRANGVIERPYG